MFLDKFDCENIEIPEFSSSQVQKSESISIYEQFDSVVIERRSCEYTGPIDINGLLQAFDINKSKSLDK